MENMTLNDVAGSIDLDSSNAVFFNKDGFITMKYKENDEQRVLLHRLFPYDEPDAYISVLDTDKNELGMIVSLDNFSGESLDAIKSELNRKYFVQKLAVINELKDRHGFTYWKATTDDKRNIEFTLHDTFRSMFKVDDDKIIITDVDGNRYMIESISGLDRSSYKKIELYL